MIKNDGRENFFKVEYSLPVSKIESQVTAAVFRLNFDDWKILKNGSRKDYFIIAAIAIIFLLVMAMKVNIIFEMTAHQTEEIGQMQLEDIRSELQGTITRAEDVLGRVASDSEKLLSDGITQDELRKFFYAQKSEQKSLTKGVCFNVYIAQKDWAIIPDFNMPADYHAAERLWYKGAQENPGEIFITPPYVDAMTDEMCFTMSKMLADGETVVSLDFNFSDLQNYVSKMTFSGDSKALIVSKSGMIIGYTDMSLVGEKISKKLPEYEPIFEKVISTKNHESFVTEFDGREYTIFSSETQNGWYMILSVYNWALYKDTYQQIILTTLLTLAMLIGIIFFYLNAMKNGLKAEKALHVKEEFLSHLSNQLRGPLHKILNISSAGVLGVDENPKENSAQIRESALQLSGMLDNLFSFSTVSTAVEEKSDAKNNFYAEDISTFSKKSRKSILIILATAMIVSLTICITTTISWGDTKMNREVDNYNHQLSNWFENQKAILSMFSNIIAEHPDLMENYSFAVEYLNDLAKHYPEISVCYMANPYHEHQVIMNNGWESPDPNWRVDQRPWYIDTIKSESGFSISAPYFDDQTGLYCITLSQIVYGKNGEFIGIFSIDFYIDKLIQLLGESYTNTSYAFLVDRNGVILNHPNNSYQMSVEKMKNVADTEYSLAYSSNKIQTVQDYSGKYFACLAHKNQISNFTVIVANSWWNIYGSIVILGSLFFILLVICGLIVRSLINRMIERQQENNDKLQEAADKATQAGLAKSQFLAQMSHEIRTPINAVLGMNEMILRESKSDDILDYSTNIQSAGRTLLTLINSILDFSKIEDGKMEIIPVRYDTMNLIDDLVNMIAEKVKKKNLEFNVDVDSNLPKSLYGDDVRVRQVITNILTNAVKYTHEGFVTLSIGGQVKDEDTLEMTVKVSDTGIGIRSEDIEKLFQSFQRLDEEKNRNIEGTGLGISIVQKLLTMMDSHLEVSSEYGKGSIFSFKLLQKIIDKNPIGNYAEHHTIRAENEDEKKFLRARRAKILAVDDNSLNLKVIRGLLKRNEIVPDLAESGKQCIELAKKNFYHIIFLDNMMPGMNGIETLHKMRDEKILNENTSVVMLTASAITGMREQYLREGFDDYLSKPIEVNELEEILAKHLPEEIVSYGDEEEISEPEEVEEVSDPETFSAKERKIFEETCPDFDLDTGLSYCMDSKSFLIEIMQEFKEDKKSEAIQAAFDANDWKNYRVLVHALKSTALTIGAKDLSDSAKELELAAKENKIDLIKIAHEILMEDYAKVRAEIKAWLKN